MNRVVVLAIVFTAAVAASFQAPAEHGSLRLFYIQKPIGTERYDVTRSQDRVKLSADFAFNDRGGAGNAARRRARHDRTRQARRPRGPRRQPARRDREYQNHQMDDRGWKNVRISGAVEERSIPAVISVKSGSSRTARNRLQADRNVRPRVSGPSHTNTITSTPERTMQVAIAVVRGTPRSWNAPTM